MAPTEGFHHERLTGLEHQAFAPAQEMVAGAHLGVQAGGVEGGPDPAMRNSQHTGLGGMQVRARPAPSFQKPANPSTWPVVASVACCKKRSPA